MKFAISVLILVIVLFETHKVAVKAVPLLFSCSPDSDNISWNEFRGTSRVSDALSSIPEFIRNDPKFAPILKAIHLGKHSLAELHNMLIDFNLAKNKDSTLGNVTDSVRD